MAEQQSGRSPCRKASARPATPRRAQGTGLLGPQGSSLNRMSAAQRSISVTVCSGLAVMVRARSARRWLPRHGTVAQHIVSPRGHKPWIPKRYRAEPLLDNRLENVIRLAIEHDGRVGVRLDVNFIKLRF